MSRKADRSKNAGMTLVELLVAVTMLSIIVVPLLHAMASSARVGLKARQELRITTAAQDIMEGLKAESAESLASAFNYPDGKDRADADNSFKNFHVISRDLVRDDTGHRNSGNVFEVRATVVEDRDSADYRNVSGLESVDTTNASSVRTADGYEFFATSDKKYYYAIKNMQVESGTKVPFVVDALIELDGSGYTSTVAAAAGTRKKTSLDSSDKALLNDHARINYSTFNEKRDAFFIQDEPLVRQTVQDFNVRYHPQMKDCTDQDLARRYVITVTNQTKLDSSKKAADDKDWITVQCQITYTSSDEFLIPDNHTDYDTSIPGPQHYRSVYEYTIFDNKATGYLPDNIFLCYYPGYGAHTPDEIIYVNADSVPSTFHIIKQEGKNNGTLNHDEVNYRCKVKIHEGAGATADHKGTGGRDSSVTMIRTNLDKNLYKIYMPAAPDVTQAEFSYNDAIITRSFSNPGASGIYALGGEQLTSDSMYDVTIDIYEKGTLDQALSTKTISNDKILFTLRGSMN